MILALFFSVAIDSSYAQSSNVKSAAILEFKSSGGLGNNELSILTNRFRGLLVKTNAFKVLEREEMRQILTEQDFVLSDGCNTMECAVQVGQLLGVQEMIAGDIGKIGQIYTIDIRVIDIETGAVLKTYNKDYKGEIEGLLGVMSEIANEIGIVGPAMKSADRLANDNRKGDFYVSSMPSGAEIFVDSRTTKFMTPHLLEDYTVGSHVIELRQGDLYARKDIEVKEGSIENINLELAIVKFPVKILSDPMGAKVIVDGTEFGVTPLSIPLSAGPHSLRLSKAGFADYFERFESSGDSKKISPVLSKGFKIIIASNPPENNAIFVQDVEVGNDYVEMCLAEGYYKIYVRSGSGHNADTTATVWVSSDNVIRFRLRPRLYFGNVIVQSNLTGAEIFLDGVKTGKHVPDTLKQIPAGHHKLSLVKDKAKFEREIAVPKGDTVIFFTAEASVRILSNFKKGEIFIDGKFSGLYTPAKVIVPFGLHLFEVRSGAFETDRKIDVQEKNLDLFLGMTTDVTIRSDVTGAKIFLDGKDTGLETPAIIKDVALSIHKVEIKHGVFFVKKEIEVTQTDKEFTIPLNPKVDLIVESEPKGARVLVNFVEKGITPAVLSVPTGKHVVQVAKENYALHTENIEFTEESSSKQMQVKLDRGAKLTVLINPVGRHKIFIDGVLAGEQKFYETLRLGVHRILIEPDESLALKSHSETIDLSSDKLIKITLVK